MCVLPILSQGLLSQGALEISASGQALKLSLSLSSTTSLGSRKSCSCNCKLSSVRKGGNVVLSTEIFIDLFLPVPVGQTLQLARRASYVFQQNSKYLGNYQSILSFSQNPVASLKILFSNPSLIKQRDKHLSKEGYLHLFAATYENEPGKLGISYYQQHDSHKFCHKVLLNMSFGNQTIF